MVNRAALMLRYKEPAVRWINEIDPDSGYEPVTLAGANREQTVYLVAQHDAATADDVQRWAEANFPELFEAELEGWCTDPDLWPQKRTFDLFASWFDIECHSVLIDTVDGPIVDDER